MDLSAIKSWSIPEGVVTKVMSSTSLLWQLINSGRIPSEYQEVEFLLADANVGAYIDLGFNFDKGATIDISLQTSGTATATYPFGAAENSGKLRCCLSCPYSATTTAYMYGSNGSDYTASVNSNITASIKVDLHIIIKKGHLQLINLTNNSAPSAVTSQAEYTMTSNLYLFAQNYNGSPRFGHIRKIYYFKYCDINNNVICELIPCYRKSDNTPGMYDTIRKIFLTNVGSGSFVCGADVGNTEPITTTLLNLVRKSTTTATDSWFNEEYYINPTNYSNRNTTSLAACVVSNLSETSITVTEGGGGGANVTYPFLICYGTVDRRGKHYRLTWVPTGSTNTRFRLLVYNALEFQMVELDVKNGGVSVADISISTDGKTITVNDVSYTFNSVIQSIAFGFSAATSTTISYRNVILQEV